MSRPVQLIVRAVVAATDPDRRDVGLSQSEDGPPETWITVRKSGWPGRWPPRPGEVVTLRLPKVLSVRRASVPSFALADTCTQANDCT